MNNSAPGFFRSTTSLFCILLLVLIQFPLISPAQSFKSSDQIFNSLISPSALEKTFAAHKLFSPLTAFSNTGSITVTDRATGASSPNGISNPYPSTIAVSGLSGTLNNITVTLNGLTTARPRDIDMVLVAPTGQNLMLMSDTGDLTATSAINLTFSDAAAAFLPTTDGSVVVGGTFKPTDRLQAIANNDVFPSPGPSAITYPGPAGTGAGSATLASVFNGINPNGNWNLYIIDDALGGGNSTISGGWSLDITTAGAAAATTTTLASSLNPSLTTQAVTFTSTTLSGGSPVTTGTVSFTQNGTAIAGCTNVAVNGSGQAVCNAAAGALPQGTLTIAAVYGGTVSFATSNTSLTQTVSTPTTVTGNQFCNNGGLTFPDNGAANPYPANVIVSGLVGTISKVTATVNGLTVPRTQDVDLLLGSPGTSALSIMSDTGDATAASNLNFVFDDAAAAQLPIGTALTGGTFKPTDGPGVADSYPSPAGAYTASAPTGTGTFASVFNGTNPNGIWKFYAVDDALGGGTGSAGGVCVTFTLNKFATSTSLAASTYPVMTGQNVTFTATVTTTGTGTPSGSVQFFDGATGIGTTALNGAGQAALTTNSLSNGNHTITAQYLGAAVGAGGGGYSPNTSNSVTEFVTPTTAANVSVAGRVISASGRGVSNALVSLIDSTGNVRSAVTNPFGNYSFTEIGAGRQYVINVAAKNKRFSPRTLNVNEEISNFDFIEVK